MPLTTVQSKALAVARGVRGSGGRTFGCGSEQEVDVALLRKNEGKWVAVDVTVIKESSVQM